MKYLIIFLKIGVYEYITNKSLKKYLQIINMDNYKNYYKDIKKHIYVLDIKSLKQICNNFGISYNIFIELNSSIKNTNEILHKEFIINNILYKIKTNKNIKIIYSKNIQNYENTNNLTENSYVYYGQYKTTDINVYNLLKNLTFNKFKFGAVSQKIIKSYWKDNILITYKQFANLWLEESKTDVKYKELAYNQFMKKSGNKTEWKKLKNESLNFLRILNYYRVYENY